ncbi:MAG: hypothetical protein PF637_12805 [Spirochaetes bacterium]|jgi:hypothetical protein|nr:hypothetical protein [Spirochaetota bacterium]
MKKSLPILIAIITGLLLVFASGCEGSGSGKAKVGEPESSPSNTAEQDTVKEPAKGSEVETSTPATTDNDSTENEAIINEETVLEEAETIIEIETAFPETDETAATDEPADEPAAETELATETENDTSDDTTNEDLAATEPSDSETAQPEESAEEIATETDSSDETSLADNSADNIEDNEADILPEAESEEPADPVTTEELLADSEPDGTIDDPTTDTEEEQASLTDEAEILLGDSTIEVITEDGSNWFQVPEQELANNPEYTELIEDLNNLVARAEEIIARIDRLQNPKAKEAQLKQLERVKDAIAEIRNKIGYSDEQSGIYAAQANQRLNVSISDVGENGYYSLSVIAKNVYGSLPEDYQFFNLTVYDESGNSVGGILIPASEDTYQKGTALVHLKAGSNNLTLEWTNDYYEEGMYDTNIQIKGILLNKTSASDRQLLDQHLKADVRTAFQYAAIDDGFYWTRDGAFTYQPGGAIAFDFPNLEKGKYKVILWVKNHGELTSKFKKFELEVSSSTGENDLVSINASDRMFKAGNSNINLAGGNTRIYITWINDGDEDVIMELKQIQLKKLGAYEGSALSAYLLGTSEGNRLLVIILLIFFASIGAGLSVYHKRQTAKA